ncbi:DUF5677 domain-containing protein [Streptomyces sp. NPDC006463]|uniref:DUF5677 domain-containing protein n=1 Tax=Streptomyces sp. NPDC006463 TaxID=3364746 RepID=UPI0036A957B6
MDLFSRVDLSKPPARRFGVSVGSEIEDAFRSRLAPLSGHLQAVELDLLFFSRAYWPIAPNPSCAAIFNHALNDFQILLKSLWDGDGRTAARTSRSLFEHLVNYKHVAGEADGAERYDAHIAITRQILARTKKRLPLLRSTPMRRELHRKAKLDRESRSEQAALIRKYGPNFARDWAKDNLRERARKVGHESDYDTYRLLSQITHGSTGGTMGTVSNNAGRTVHRLGPSFELAALSYPEGISFFRDLCQHINSSTPIHDGRIVSTLNSLTAGWGTFKEACEWIDRNLWPDSPPPPPVAILAIYPNGRTRWFLWEPSLGLIVPGMPQQDLGWIEENAKGYMNFKPDGTFSGDGEGRPITVRVLDVQLSITPTAKWVPAEAILQKKSASGPSDTFRS